MHGDRDVSNLEDYTMTQRDIRLAPELETCHWINCRQALRIEQLRGKVIVLHAFQMLCPGCVVHGLPQASSIHALYPKDQLELIGLHTVFEHHDVMAIEALEVFVKEYRLQFPIAVDAPGISSAIPRTMQKYELKGTPSLVLIDKRGYIRANHFGRLSDMEVGNQIGRLVQEDWEAVEKAQAPRHGRSESSPGCGDEGCELE